MPHYLGRLNELVDSYDTGRNKSFFCACLTDREYEVVEKMPAYFGKNPCRDFFVDAYRYWESEHTPVEHKGVAKRWIMEHVREIGYALSPIRFQDPMAGVYASMNTFESLAKGGEPGARTTTGEEGRLLGNPASASSMRRVTLAMAGARADAATYVELMNRCLFGDNTTDPKHEAKVAPSVFAGPGSPFVAEGVVVDPLSKCVREKRVVPIIRLFRDNGDTFLGVESQEMQSKSAGAKLAADPKCTDTTAEIVSEPLPRVDVVQPVANTVETAHVRNQVAIEQENMKNGEDDEDEIVVLSIARRPARNV